MDIKIIINLNTDNSAFDNYNSEVKRILDGIVFKIMKLAEVHSNNRDFKNTHETDTKLYNVPDREYSESIGDTNGNEVGDWTYEEVSE